MGSAKITGKIVGYLNYKLPDSYRRGQHKGGILLKTSSEAPAEWDTTGFCTKHEVAWEWNCCEDPPKKTTIVSQEPK